MADLDTGAVLRPGEIGEIQVRSPSVMAGYLPAEATAEAFADGWYRTGDVGWLEPEGWVHLTDRSKEMIKVNGFQVAPAEIEAVLHGHPAVLDCAVFGLADERAGEVPVAAVQLDPDRPSADGELQQLVADSLATYKQLRHVVVVDAIPRLPSGKVLRRTLRDEWTPAAGRDAGPAADGRPALPRAGGTARRCGPDGRPAGAPARWRSSMTPSGPPSWRPPWPRPAGASCGWRRTAMRRWPRGSRWPSWPRSSVGGLADAPFLGPTLAAELRRWPAQPAATVPETVALDPTLAALAVARAGVVPGRCPGHRRPEGAPPRCCSCRPAPGHGLGQVPLSATEVRTDLTRPVAAPGPAVAVVADGGTGRPLDTTTTSGGGRPSGWP